MSLRAYAEDTLVQQTTADYLEHLLGGGSWSKPTTMSAVRRGSVFVLFSGPIALDRSREPR